MFWARSYVLNDRLIWLGIHRGRLLEKPVEELAAVAGAPPVEPESKFVEIEFHAGVCSGAY